jgi:hypothetical protein
MTKILSLDGGGSWALLQVRALQEIYGPTYGPNMTGYDVLRNFDLVAANSGGTIVAATLAAGWPLSTTMNFFLSQAQRQTIFSELPLVDRLGNAVLGLGPKYDTAQKLIGLTNAFGAFAPTKMDQLPALLLAAANAGHRVDFIITTFDYDRRRAAIFRSNTASKAAPLTQVPVPSMIEAVHASSTAPVNFFNNPAVFPEPQFQPYRFWDGGVTGMNNPVLAGVLDALSNGNAANTINVLSLGTGTVRQPIFFGTPPSPLYLQAATPGTITDLKELASAIVDDPPDEASIAAYISLGGPLPNPGDAIPIGTGTFVRLSPLVQPIGTFPNYAPPAFGMPGMTDIDVFQALANLPMDAVEDSQVALIQALAGAWISGAAYNQPIRSNTNLGFEVGHQFFAQGKADWLAQNPPV